jgi:hypothetical protein
MQIARRMSLPGFVAVVPPLPNALLYAASVMLLHATSPVIDLQILWYAAGHKTGRVFHVGGS